MYILNRRPRGFHHTFRFSNERRDLINELRNGTPPEELAAKSLREQTDSSRSRLMRSNSLWLSSWLVVALLILVLAFILAVL